MLKQLFFLRGVLLSFSTLLVACSSDPLTGPIPVIWDRDICVRCNMVLSDRYHSAQVREFAGAEDMSKVHVFDDLGCAVLWLEQQGLAAGTYELWVNDYKTGEWIDARSAHYVTGNPTPMEYGVSASSEPTEGSLDFASARLHIERVANERNIHGGPAGHFHRSLSSDSVSTPVSSVEGTIH